ncbi:DegV family protein [Arenicella xantha]|uniref:Fatty acid-binding protein DegV n=1 Tax=Arenicella xantha TaxID=644221 RepID=A0A395JJA9_9GAMM|nr:DegV family protein [Arenicella xantha]RBP49943.1 fatty acid-binding protein DegV [Arenicella xantha]
MKYTIVVDSVAAIPESIFKTRPIKVLPITININGAVKPEIVDERVLIKYYKSGELNVKTKIKTAPPSPEQITEFILNEVAPHADFAFCQTFSKTASPIYDNFEKAASAIAKRSREVRDKLGIEHPFRMTYLNTGTGIAAQGLVAIYADMLLSRGADVQEYTKAMNKFTQVIRSYAIVRDIFYSRQRALEKGIKSVGLAPALLGKAVGLTPIIENYGDKSGPVVTKRSEEKALDSLLRYAIDRVKEGLYVPIVNISYAGDLEDIHAMPIIDELKAVAMKHKVKVLFGVMKLGSSMMYGPGGFSIGLAPKNNKAKPE